jgi:hypothetical protein
LNPCVTQRNGRSLFCRKRVQFGQL